MIEWWVSAFRTIVRVTDIIRARSAPPRPPPPPCSPCSTMFACPSSSSCLAGGALAPSRSSASLPTNPALSSPARFPPSRPSSLSILRCCWDSSAIGPSFPLVLGRTSAKRTPLEMKELNRQKEKLAQPDDDKEESGIVHIRRTGNTSLYLAKNNW